jgi:hypothetical protein
LRRRTMGYDLAAIGSGRVEFVPTDKIISDAEER